MPIYHKICIICQHKFKALRLNRLYCSKACSNRTRYLPQELVESLIQRNAMYTLKATGYVAMVTDKEGYATTVDASAESITEEHPLGKEEGLLIAAALVAKDEREAENRRKQKEIEDKKLQEQEQQKSLESNSGFSTVNEDDVNLINKVRKPPQNTLQKYKIRPIGG